jgi:hypothetical protein
MSDHEKVESKIVDKLAQYAIEDRRIGMIEGVAMAKQILMNQPRLSREDFIKCFDSLIETIKGF